MFYSRSHQRFVVLLTKLVSMRLLIWSRHRAHAIPSLPRVDFFLSSSI